MNFLLFAQDYSALISVGVIVGAIVILGLATAFALSKFYQKVGPEEALVRAGGGRLLVATGAGMWVVPIVHRIDRMDLTLKRIEIARDGVDGLICRDNIRADIKVIFFVRVNKTKEDVIKVAQAIGCARASDKQTLDELFSAKFSEALKTVGKQLDFVDL